MRRLRADPAENHDPTSCALLLLRRVSLRGGGAGGGGASLRAAPRGAAAGGGGGPSTPDPPRRLLQGERKLAIQPAIRERCPIRAFHPRRPAPRGSGP